METMDSSDRQEIEHEVASRSWETLRRRLGLPQTDAQHGIFRAHDLNSDGRTLFHIVCANRDAPSDLIQRMIDMDVACLTQTSDREGKTALHLAAETGSAGTVKILLDRMTKLHQCDVSKASRRRSERRSWVNNVSLNALDMLWKNRLKANLIWEDQNKEDVRSAVDLLKQMDRVTCCADMTEELQDLWDKTQCFVHAARSGARQSEEQGHIMPRGEEEEQRWILHDMVRCGGTEEVSFPREALWLASKLHPHLLQTRDDDGDLPLHLALRSPLRCSWSALECCKMSETYARDDEDLKLILTTFTGCTVVSLLLREFPKAASMKDGVGRLPLQIVCDNLLSERHPVDLTGRDVQSLVKAAPEAVFRKDKEGNAPLHVLCKFMCRSGNRRKRHSLHPEYVARYAIFHMIKVTPQAAYVRDRSGRLPLHILLDDDDCPAAEQQPPSALRDMDALAMVKLAPDALDVPNGATGLLPFMTAAVGDKFSMDCAYTLLRRNPANVSNRGGSIKQKR